MERHFAPMGAGLETDMETGAPVVPQELTRKSREAERRTRAMDRHIQLVNDLAGPGGTVLRQIAAKLIVRIGTLIAGDAEATAYLTILQETQANLVVGEALVNRELESIFSRENLP
jgi:hypothetical protein